MNRIKDIVGGLKDEDGNDSSRNDDSKMDEKGNTSLIEVPFELPPEVPNLYEVEYDKSDSVLDTRPRLTIHVEVNRTGCREGARRYSNVDLWTEGYNHPPSVFSDVMNELKVHDEKSKENLRANTSRSAINEAPKSKSMNREPSLEGSPSVSEEKKIIKEPLVDFSHKEDEYGPPPIDEAPILPNQSTPNITRTVLSSENQYTVTSQVKTKTHTLKVKKAKYRSRDVTCYSIGDKNSEGFAFKYSPSKGSCLVTPEHEKPTKILEPEECALIMIKILPGKPTKIRVIR